MKFPKEGDGQAANASAEAESPREGRKLIWDAGLSKVLFLEACELRLWEC